ncbi:MAG: hypothetical protein ACJ73L_11065 [Actinomycetes bacterium]
MRKAASIGATLMLAGTALLTAPEVAVADTPGCVTHAEFTKVKDGMTMRRVHRIFDTNGVKAVAPVGKKQRWYDKCSSPVAVADVWYRNDRVIGKHWR